MKKIAALLSLIIFLFLMRSSTNAAGYCNFSPEGANGQPYGDVIISSSCVIYESVNGTSQGNLTLQNSIITLNSTLVFSPGKQINIGSGSILYINTNGKITQSGLCIKDADGDGYADVITLDKDPESGLPLTNPITQIGKIEANADGSCPSGYRASDTNVQNLTMVDADPLTPSSTAIATSDRELLRLGFTINGVTDALAAVGDIQIVNKNLLVCNGISCPADNFANLTPSTGNVYVGGKVGIGTTNPAVALDVNGQTYLSDGTAGAPAFTFRSDTNTGFYRQSTDLLSFVANGQNALNISGEAGVGRIMIGNGSPVSRLQLNDDNNNAASGITFGGNASTYLQLYKSASNALALMGGKLGIGTTNPTSTLTLESTSENTIRFTDGETLRSIIGIAAGSGQITTGSVDNDLILRNQAGKIMFTSDGGANNTMVMTGGNVGIGTTIPGWSTKLQVAGRSLFTSGVPDPGDGSPTGVSIGYNTSADYGFIDALQTGVAAKKLILNQSGGNVGIGTTTPGYKLDVAGTINAGKAGGTTSTINFPAQANDPGYIKHIENSNIAEMRFSVSDDVSSDYFTFGADPGGVWTEKVRIQSNGNVGIGTNGPSYKLQVVGSLYAGGSSREYKENISPLTLDSSRIYELNPVSYDYKEAYRDLGKQLSGGRQFGLIAEDVFAVYPELALSDGTRNIANVDYEKLSVLLLAEMKNHKKEIDSLKSENQQLKNKLNNLELRLQKLELLIK